MFCLNFLLQGIYRGLLNCGLETPWKFAECFRGSTKNKSIIFLSSTTRRKTYQRKKTWALLLCFLSDFILCSVWITQTYNLYLRSEVLMVMKMSVVVLRVLMPYGLEIYQRFGGAYNSILNTEDGGGKFCLMVVPTSNKRYSVPQTWRQQSSCSLEQP